jgi:hypothetical protein
MDMAASETVVYVLSDSVGETAELVVRAALRQFEHGQVTIRRIPYVEDLATIEEMVHSAKENNAIIVFTLVLPEHRRFLLEKANELGVLTVDIMGPMIRVFEEKLQQAPKLQPGLAHQLDEEYFRRVEAIEFAVKYDDGRDSRGILRADVVLIGVSRTSKTPLSMYLAHKRYKVANVPLIPEVEPPEELFQIPPHQCIGLTIKPEQLVRIRSERLKSLGLTSTANYANPERIAQELAYADEIMKRIGCKVIDVSNKAVEETANLILDMLRQGSSGR